MLASIQRLMKEDKTFRCPFLDIAVKTRTIKAISQERCCITVTIMGKGFIRSEAKWNV